MAYGTAVGGIPQMIDHGESGYRVPPRMTQQLAARPVSLPNPPTAHRMGRAGRDRVEAEFDLDRSVAAAQQVIAKGILSGRD
jgi:glycosyltransferase involved in cell wall biosynthesis